MTTNNSEYPFLFSLIEAYRVRSPKELAKLRQDARSERMARKKGKLSGKAKKRSKARQGVLKADAEEDAIYSRDFRVQDSYISFKSAIDSLVQESKNKYDKWSAEAHGSAETPQSDEADVQAALDRHPSNPANAKKKRKRTRKAHYGRIKTSQGDALDIDYPSDSGRY